MWWPWSVTGSMRSPWANPVYALLAFDRDGAAAEFVATAGGFLLRSEASSVRDQRRGRRGPARRSERLAGPVQSERPAVSSATNGSSSWGRRVASVTSPSRSARARGAFVIGTASPDAAEWVLGLGAHEVPRGPEPALDATLDPVDLVFDTVGGQRFARAADAVHRGAGWCRSPSRRRRGSTPTTSSSNRTTVSWWNSPRSPRTARSEPEIDSVYPLEDARAAFERSMAGGKRGKVVLRVVDE